MRGFKEYVSSLTDVLAEVAAGTRDTSSADVRSALNGGANAALHRLVGRDELRDSGVFFTGGHLSTLAIKSLASTVDQSSVILDPACGAGDLLLAALKLLEPRASINETIEGWSNRLMGRDLFQEFVDATRLRLTLATLVDFAERAGQEQAFPVSVAELSAFVNIEQTCGLTDSEAVRAATHIVMNPPFAQVEAPHDCDWGGGKVNAAALFLDECLKHARPGARIVAILPDVLRSGTRYQRWRQCVTTRGTIKSIQLCGQFENDVDVDVFLLHLLVGPSTPTCDWHGVESSEGRTIGDVFSVRIGSVVDYRDPHQGTEHPFITSKKLPSWTAVTNISAQRRFAGKVFSPPFVVVRRTSRRGDTHRAIATLVATDRDVAVENHLVVLQPRGPNKQQLCEDLLSVLADRRTSSWLDQRIRCRHLTVTALREIPWLGA